MNTQQFQKWLQNQSYNSESDYYLRPLVMGILNITSDSFFDGGKFLAKEQALSHARHLIAQGADIIDIGGESSRPGAVSISVNEELDRVIPVIESLRNECDTLLSVDTCKPDVMRASVAAGAFLVNDISGLSNKSSMALLAEMQQPVCLMHMQGTPETMQINPSYKLDIIDEINQFFSRRIAECMQMGIHRENIILDPGFGFGKTVQHNLKIVKNLSQFTIHKLPVLLGVSRKSTIGQILGKPVGERLIGSITLTTIAALQHVGIIRTHDVEETLQSLRIIEAMNATQTDLLQ